MSARAKSKTKSITYVAAMTAFIAVCAWITVPFFSVPFTMQTFGVFLALKLLGGKKGTASILLYIALGGIGVPVFHGFSGGPAVLFGPTGGYIIGFIVSGAIYTALGGFCKKPIGNILVTALMLISCYAFGTAWFVILMANKHKAVGVFSALSMCVIPFIIPDAVKLFFADRVAAKIRKNVRF